jgi:hypothetical protein
VQGVKGKKDRTSPSQSNVGFPGDASQFSLIAKEGFGREPFKAAFVDATTRDEAEKIFRRALDGKEAQIDEILVKKFCALAIYHDPNIPTV